MSVVNLPYDRAAGGRLLNVAQVMEDLNCSRAHVYRLVKGGDLKAIRLGGTKGLRITFKSLERFKVRRRVDFS